MSIFTSSNVQQENHYLDNDTYSLSLCIRKRIAVTSSISRFWWYESLQNWRYIMKWVAEIEIFLPVWVPGLNQCNWIESVWSQWGRELEADNEFPLSIPISAGKDLQVHLAHLLVTLLNTTRVWDFNLTYFICNVHQCSLLNKLNICSSVKYSLHWWHFAHRVWCAKKIIFSENVEFDTWLGIRDPSCKVLQGLLYQTVKLRKLHEIF